MTINEAQDAVIEEFSDFTDWMDKYQMLIDLIDKIGLRQHLSPTRSNGLLSMVKRIKAYALAFSLK